MYYYLISLGSLKYNFTICFFIRIPPRNNKLEKGFNFFKIHLLTKVRIFFFNSNNNTNF